jgi:tetratricopeptide (TPR) repeat protein
VPTDLLQSLDAYWGAQSERTEHGYVQLYTALAHAADAPLSVADRTALLGRALAQFRKAGSLTGQATTLFWQSHLLLAQGDLPQAQLAAEAMHALVERVGDPLGRSWAQMALGQVALAHGQMEEAAELLEAALAGFQQLGQEIGELTLLQTLSRLAVQRGQLQQAYELLSRSVQLAQMRDDAPMLYKCAIVLAGILVADTKPLAALELLGAVSVVGETGVPVAWEFRGVYEQLVSVAREGADPEAAAAAWRAGGEAHVADVIVKHLAPAASPLV